MNIDELCKEVNRALRERKIRVVDGRTASLVTPRNIRYYRTMGLLTPPGRSGGRATYDKTHVHEIIAIKQSQAEGVTLEQLRENRSPRATRPPSGQTDLGLRSVAINALHAPDLLGHAMTRSESARRPSSDVLKLSLLPPDEPEADTSPWGWSVRVGEYTLSGSGERPSLDQLAVIERILTEEDDYDDTE